MRCSIKEQHARVVEAAIRQGRAQDADDFVEQLIERYEEDQSREGELEQLLLERFSGPTVVFDSPAEMERELLDRLERRTV